MNEPPVSERVKVLLDLYEYGNKAAMGRNIGISGQGVADLIQGKKGGPSFPVLQKMLKYYSQIRAEWLIFGEEPMLRSEFEQLKKLPTGIITEESGASVDLSFEQWRHVYDIASEKLFKDEKVRKEAATKRAFWQIDANAQTQVYSVLGKPDPSRPYNGLLTERLNISDEEARELILSGEIRSKYIGFGEKSHRITNYRVTERAVREFLGEPFTEERMGNYI